MITIKQNGNNIIGTNNSQIKMITGTRKGDTIKFQYYARHSTIKGKWKIIPGGARLPDDIAPETLAEINLYQAAV